MSGTSNITGIAQSGAASRLPQGLPGGVVEHPTNSSQELRTPTHTPTTELTGEQLREVVQSVEEAIAFVNRSIRFRVDDSTDTLVTLVINRDTNEVIRQVPPEEMLALARRLREFIGLFLDVEV